MARTKVPVISNLPHVPSHVDNLSVGTTTLAIAEKTEPYVRDPSSLIGMMVQ
jgi:hypothetical protein